MNSKYNNYSEIPFYKKQLFFWVMFFIFFPIPVFILLADDIYYERNGKIESFGIFNKIIIVIIVIIAISKIIA